MKLYALYAGSITQPDKGANTPGYGDGEKFTFPVGIYLIDHPDGLALVDTGIDPAYWPDFMKADADDGEHAADKLIENAGFNPADVKYVILSHMHVDHTGGMKLFPNATFIVRQSELQFAWWPTQRGVIGCGYCFADFNMTRDFKYIELPDDEDYDVFGDGRVILIDAKGHSRGTQAVVLNLDNEGKIVLALDAIGFRENLELRVQPGRNLWNYDEAMKSIDKILALKEEGAKIFLGHDPDFYKTIRWAPDYYE